MSGEMCDEAFVAAILAELEAGRAVGLASVLAVARSMPRHEGAHLAVLADGSCQGTVGGGRIEVMAEAAARAVLAGEAAPSLEWYTQVRTGMACGGDALVGIVRLEPACDLALFRELAGLLASHGAAVLEESWADPASPVLTLDAGARPHGLGWQEGRQSYREYVSAPTRLHIFGAGHVGQALVPVAASLDFEVRVYDDRPAMADPERLPGAASVTCGPFEQTAAEAGVTPDDFVVVLTHGHVDDATVLERVLPARPAYAGCIGSRTKVAYVHGRLARAGVPQEAIDALHLPIGEAIGAQTPAEIAVSIAAQLIRRRSQIAQERRL